MQELLSFNQKEVNRLEKSLHKSKKESADLKDKVTDLEREVIGAFFEVI